MSKSPLASAGHDHHVQPISMYVKTFFALGFFMALTIVASYILIPDQTFGPITIRGNIINNAIALGIASVKTYIVVMYFMHTKWATNLTKLWAMIGFIWFTLMFIMFADYGTRQYEEVHGWETIKDGAMPRTPKFDSTPIEDKNLLDNRPRY